MHNTYVIIGNSAAGIAAMRMLRKLDPEGQIICFSKEAELPYNTCFLADALSGEKTYDQVAMLTKEMIEQLRIDMHLGVTVVDVVSDKQKVMLSDGRAVAYDYLLIATGSRPYIPPIKGLAAHERICTFATLYDTQKLDAMIKEKHIKHAVVLGAGLSGLEVADSLHARGVSVTVIERADQVLARHVNTKGAACIMQQMAAQGITCLVQTAVQEVDVSHANQIVVTLEDGRIITTDLLVCATGARQNIELAQSAGAMCDAFGVQVNAHMQTSVPHVYAAGDIIGMCDTITGTTMASCTWPDAMQQGMHAAYAMAGQPRLYAGGPVIVSSAFFGVKFSSCGPMHDVPEAYEIHERTGEQFYHRYIVHNDQLKGFLLVGNTQRFALLKRALLTGQSASSLLS